MRPLSFVLLVLLLAGCPQRTPPPAGPPQPPVTLPSGLTYQVLSPGQGDAAAAGSRIKVHYTGTLEDGTVFDSSRPRGEPFTFRLGQGHVIKGWDEGLVGMKEGERRKLTIPPALGYGSSGQGPIPPNATLIFAVEFVDAG